MFVRFVFCVSLHSKLKNVIVRNKSWSHLSSSWMFPRRPLVAWYDRRVAPGCANNTVCGGSVLDKPARASRRSFGHESEETELRFKRVPTCFWWFGALKTPTAAPSEPF